MLYQKTVLRALFITTVLAGGFAQAKTCLYINSYHHGYDWSDGIERALEAGLKGKCNLLKFEMDSKRHPELDFIKKKALEAKALIEEKKPDIVLTSDDNAVKYILQPFFKNAKVPFVFNGVNWSTEEYGLPYTNATGMIEISPIEPISRIAKEMQPDLKKAVFLSSDNESERIDFKFSKKIMNNFDIELSGVFVKNYSDWKKAYLQAQKTADLILLNNSAGINDFDNKDAEEFVLKNTKKVSAAVYRWMMPMSMYGLMKQPEEQGEFSARTAIQILDGAPPSSIPVWSNKRYDATTNDKMFTRSPVAMPLSLAGAVKWTPAK